MSVWPPVWPPLPMGCAHPLRSGADTDAAWSDLLGLWWGPCQRLACWAPGGSGIGEREGVVSVGKMEHFQSIWG